MKWFVLVHVGMCRCELGYKKSHVTNVSKCPCFPGKAYEGTVPDTAGPALTKERLRVSRTGWEGARKVSRPPGTERWRPPEAAEADRRDPPGQGGRP